MATTSPKTMKGDLGKQRQEQAKGFKQAPSRSTADAWGSAKPNITRESDYSKPGSVRVMEHPPQKDISGLRGIGYKTVRSHAESGSKRPTQATSFKSYPLTGPPQGNESPSRGEGPTTNSNEV